MSLPNSDETSKPHLPVILLTGASGYVGGRLIPLLEQQPVVLRCLARSPDKLRPLVKGSTQVVRGDVLDPPSLDEALKGVDTAYYLVHLMSGSGSKDFERADRQAAQNFAAAAKKARVSRIIYLGGLAMTPILIYRRIFAAVMKSEKFCEDQAWKQLSSERGWS